MEKIQNKLKQLKTEMEKNREVFNKDRLVARNVKKYQDNYFKKQDLLRAEIDKCERQETLYSDLKELGVVK